MKNFKILIVLFLGMILLLFTGCSSPTKEIVFQLEENDVELHIGDTYEPKILIENISDYDLEYSYDTQGLKIEDGIIKCLTDGFFEVQISIKGKEEIQKLVLNLYVSYIIPTEIKCEEQIKIYLNESYQLKPTVEPSNATALFNYSSNNKKIVDVSETGELKAISEGETYVVIRSQFSKKVNTRVLVIVEKPPVESIESISSLTLNYNETYQLTWEIKPALAEQSVLFEVSDESIASISEEGLITAYKYGTTTIKIISSKDSSKYFEITLKVEGDKATDIKIEEEQITMQLGEEYKLNYSIEPSTAYQGVNVSVDDKEGIEITNDVICAKKVGNYKITLSTIDETNITKVINIKVEGEDTPIFVTNSIFDNQNILSWNEEFNPLNNIRAFDDKDGDITNKIVVTGKVDNRRYGEYVLEYRVEDSNGNTKVLTRTINVVWGYDVTVIGHAGSYYGVPNSEEAILYAAEVLKYPAIEIDLKQTKDGVFVLSHDPNWGDAKLESTNYEDLKNVEYTVKKNAGIVEGNLTDAQRTYTAKICTFERYLEICKQYNIIAIIELKTSAGISNWTEANAPQSSKMPKIMELIKKYDMLENVVFLSSQELCLNWVKTNGYESIPCQYLTLSSCESETTYNIVKKYKLDISFNVRDGIKISDEWLEKYRALGCKLAVFTFEEWASYSDIQTWIDRGVDYVTTDWHSLDKLELPKKDDN